MAVAEITLNWREKYSTLEEYYKTEYDSKYFSFNRYELEVDPMEPMEEIEEYSPERQQKEILKCAVSFPYFCTKYVKITHPKRGLLPFILYKYQKKVIEEYERHRYTILSKFRQGGLTTVTTNWALWRCLFKLDETILVVSKSDREAIAAGEIVKRALDELPSWMQPEMSKNNDHQKIFMDTGCKLFFYTPEAARGRSITYLILDEAAFIPQMEKHWKALFPTIATGGNCICISTVNGVGNWYYDIYQGAKKEPPQNDFHIIDLDYWEHPEYNDPKWVAETRAQLGEKGWLQEVMRDFLGAGDNFFPAENVAEIVTQTRKEEFQPIRMLFPDWNNQAEAREQRVADVNTWVRGALHIWKEPMEGREYIMGVDTGEGQGEENDNSCFQIIDARTCEQVAEFYSNICPIHNFAQAVSMVAKTYNSALVVVESQGPGLAVLEKLQHEFYYDNLYQSIQGSSKNAKAGIKTAVNNRPKYLEALRTRVINKSIMIRSRRFAEELRGFIWNNNTHRAEAAKGFHDDAIMAMCLALYIRDERIHQMPVGLDGMEPMTEKFKAEIYQSIRDELLRDAPEKWSNAEAYEWLRVNSDEEGPPSIIWDVAPAQSGLLSEFGWWRNPTM
jgi:hypothetical protein